MNQGIELDVVLTGCSTRQDDSLSLRFETPELTAEHAVVLLKLRKTALNMRLTVKDEQTEVLEVKSELNPKSPSTRLRGVLYRWWESIGSPGQWEAFYLSEMEKRIDDVKAKLPKLPF